MYLSDFLSKLNSIAIFVIIGVVIVTLLLYRFAFGKEISDIFDKEGMSLKILRQMMKRKEAQAGDETSADDEVRKGVLITIFRSARDPVDDVTRIIKDLVTKQRSKLERRENKREINRCGPSI